MLGPQTDGLATGDGGEDIVYQITVNEPVTVDITLTTDAKVTLDGRTIVAADLKPGTKIRVTLQRDTPHAAIRVEAIDKNPEFASL